MEILDRVTYSRENCLLKIAGRRRLREMESIERIHLVLQSTHGPECKTKLNGVSDTGFEMAGILF